MRIGSLFSGIGGLELGLERAGVGHVVWQVEIDEYCRAVLAKHWPDARRPSDVRRVHSRDLCWHGGCGSCLDPVDVICGGFPCQDISTAGEQRGIHGERSGLWAEYVRLIREIRPRFIVVENVSALLTRGWFGVVLGDLADLGYDAEWSCIQACDVGAPHKRDRLFVVAYAADELRRSNRRGVEGSEGAGESQASAWRVRQGHWRAGDGGPLPRSAFAPDDDSTRQLQPKGSECDRWGRSGDSHWWESEPNVGRVAYGLPTAVDRNAALGNAVVPQVAEVVGRVLLQIHQELTDGIVSTPTRASD